MGYVVYEKESTAIPVKLRNKVYKTPGAAQACITRLSKVWFNEEYTPNYPNVDRGEDPVFKYAIAEVNYYCANIEKKVERVNMMSGKTYMESVNTPSYCSPSSESYWSA